MNWSEATPTSLHDHRNVNHQAPRWKFTQSDDELVLGHLHDHVREGLLELELHEHRDVNHSTVRCSWIRSEARERQQFPQSAPGSSARTRTVPSPPASDLGWWWLLPPTKPRHNQRAQLAHPTKLRGVQKCSLYATATSLTVRRRARSNLTRPLSPAAGSRTRAQGRGSHGPRRHTPPAAQEHRGTAPQAQSKICSTVCCRTHSCGPDMGERRLVKSPWWQALRQRPSQNTTVPAAWGGGCVRISAVQFIVIPSARAMVTIQTVAKELSEPSLPPPLGGPLSVCYHLNGCQHEAVGTKMATDFVTGSRKSDA